MKKFALACLAGMFSLTASAEVPLYETGPSQDSSFVRFLNAAGEKANITNGAAKIALGAQGNARVSRFYPVKAGDKLKALVQVGAQKSEIEVVAKPGEFITIALISSGKNLENMQVRETSTDFNAMRASIALLNFDTSCASANLSGGSKGAAIFDAIKPGHSQRRMINPVKLSVSALCTGDANATQLDLSQLEAGERYSVILLPTKKGRQLFFVRDSTS